MFASNHETSQIEPSFNSPSPVITIILCFLFCNFAAIAIPTPIGSPCPSAPVEASTPGTLPYSGCPPKIDSSLQMFLILFY